MNIISINESNLLNTVIKFITLLCGKDYLIPNNKNIRRCCKNFNFTICHCKVKDKYTLKICILPYCRCYINFGCNDWMIQHKIKIYFLINTKEIKYLKYFVKRIQIFYDKLHNIKRDTKYFNHGIIMNYGLIETLKYYIMRNIFNYTKKEILMLPYDIRKDIIKNKNLDFLDKNRSIFKKINKHKRQYYFKISNNLSLNDIKKKKKYISKRPYIFKNNIIRQMKRRRNYFN